jgi:hypothetical protein
MNLQSSENFAVFICNNTLFSLAYIEKGFTERASGECKIVKKFYNLSLFKFIYKYLIYRTLFYFMNRGRPSRPV